jgi:hypothetical protein
LFDFDWNFFLNKRGGSDSACEEGHIGSLCGDCEATYSKLGDTCVTCIDPLVNLIRLILALTLYLAFIGLYIAYYFVKYLFFFRS